MMSQFAYEFFKALALIGSISLIYLLAKYPTRAVGTTPRTDANFEELAGLPLVGNLFSQILHSGHPLEWTTATALKHGPGWSFTFPGLRIIDISKPEWIEYVQKTNFSNYIKGAVIHQVMSDVFGDGIFVNDGERWKSTRQCTSRIFHVNSFRNVIMPSLDQGLRSLCKTLHYKADQDLNVDFCSIFYKFTLQSFIKMTFGKDLNILEAETCSDPHSHSSSSTEFASAFDYAQNQLDWRFAVMTGWSIFENVFSSKGNKMRAACKTLDHFVYALIDEKQIPDNSESPDNGRDLLELFMKAKDDTGRSLQRAELRDAVLNLIVAGRDTTAQALAWAFFHLIMNTHLINRILEEADELGEDVAYDNYKQYIWTQAVICEALRLHPSVPKNMKFAIHSDRIPGGPVIQPGDAVRWGYALGQSYPHVVRGN